MDIEETSLKGCKEYVLRKEKRPTKGWALFGASDEARTRYLHLGKVALYQMSYTRNSKVNYTTNPFAVKSFLKNF